MNPKHPTQIVGGPPVSGGGLREPTPDEQPMMFQLLDTYRRNLEELFSQITRVRAFNDRVDGAQPPSEAKAETATPSSVLSRIEHLNMDLRDAVAALAEEANRLERIS